MKKCVKLCKQLYSRSISCVHSNYIQRLDFPLYEISVVNKIVIGWWTKCRCVRYCWNPCSFLFPVFKQNDPLEGLFYWFSMITNWTALISGSERSTKLLFPESQVEVGSFRYNHSYIQEEIHRYNSVIYKKVKPQYRIDFNTILV